MKQPNENLVAIKQRIEAPAPTVAAYIGDFRNAKEWMVGVEGVERLAEDVYRLRLESPVGKLEPEVKVLEHNDSIMRWAYTSTIEGGGEVSVAPSGPDFSSCIVSYLGDFELKGKVMNRAARLVGMERFARKNGERSLLRLKQLMEARRY
jgi:carbon monoxide dehydrogenase subunit G